MKTVILSPSAGFEEWRSHARHCLGENIPPHHIIWGKEGGQGHDLFADTYVTLPNSGQSQMTISKEFYELACQAACHKDSERFPLLYKILWRLKTGEQNLLRLKTDDDVLRLYSCVKAVRRDAYKIKAFLRFRETETEGEPHFIAWYEPEHYTLRLSLPFFQTRFKNMTWSILTPYLAAHWDQEKLQLHYNPDPSQYPKDDEVEGYWLKYYATTFNPARPKKQAMLNQMPKKYWKNLPESVLIEDMLRQSGMRTRNMLKTEE